MVDRESVVRNVKASDFGMASSAVCSEGMMVILSILPVLRSVLCGRQQSFFFPSLLEMMMCWRPSTCAS